MRCIRRLTSHFLDRLHYSLELSQLCTCWGITQNQLTNLSTRAQSKLSTPGTSISAHPQLYRDALSETKFFCLLQKLLRICGYDDFGLRDLAAPNARRFRRQLSACINFMKFREDNKHTLDTVLEDVSLWFCLGGLISLRESAYADQSIARLFLPHLNQPFIIYWHKSAVKCSRI